MGRLLAHSPELEVSRGAVKNKTAASMLMRRAAACCIMHIEAYILQQIFDANVQQLGHSKCQERKCTQLRANAGTRKYHA